MVNEQTIPIFDGHNDTLTHLDGVGGRAERSFFVESAEGHIDLPRARRGGLAGGFFAIFTPDLAQAQLMKENLVISETGYEVLPLPALDPVFAQQWTMAMMARLFRLEKESQGQVKVVRSVDELERCLGEGVLAMVLHFEGAEAIDPELDALEVFYQAGLRSLGLVWSRPNAFGHGVPFKFPHTPDIGPGLTSAGKRLVQACNRLGIMLDLAHLNEQGFWDVVSLTDAPIVVTHTAVHALCPSTRNLTDRQLLAIKDSEGIVGLNFDVADLREDASQDRNTSLAVMIRHIDYLVEKLGIEGVSLGSDFDGGITVAQELGDVAGLPKLMGALRDHGYDEGALRKIGYENWVRVLRRTWRG
jgi:membrane dipeptidase